MINISYAGGPSVKSEVKTLDGVTRGSYSYIDAESKLQTVNYVADSLGFRVAATNLPTAPVDTNAAPVDSNKAPKQVEDTAEVKQARAEHLAAVAQAKNENADANNEAPEQVEDTEEVKQAREEHLQAVEDAKVRNSVPVSAEIVQTAKPAAIHLAQPAVVQLAHGPIAVVRSDPGAAFAYSVVAPGHPQLILG
jgi:Insect cuticle protein